MLLWKGGIVLFLRVLFKVPYFKSLSGNGLINASDSFFFNLKKGFLGRGFNYFPLQFPAGGKRIVPW